MINKKKLSDLVTLSLTSDKLGNFIPEIATYHEKLIKCPSIGENGRTVIIGYDLAKKILLDSENFSSRKVAENTLKSMPHELAEKMKPMKSWPLYSDKEEHIKSRKMMLSIFNKNLLNDLTPIIEKNVDKTINPLLKKKNIDILKSIADPIPLKTFCYVIGIDDSYALELKSLTSNLQNMTEPNLSKQAIQKIKHAWDSLYYLFDKIIEQNLYKNGYFIESLLKEGVPKEEIKNHCVSMLFGAHETTSSLIANTINQLLSHPDQLSLLEKNPELISNAVEETLRFDPPAKLTARVSLGDINVNNFLFKKNECLMIYFGCTNRDPDIQEDPHQFLIQRPKQNHLSFGYGVHACFGAALSKIQTMSVIKKILPYLKLYKINSIEYVDSMVFRKMNEFTIIKR